MMAHDENTPTYNLGVIVQETGINPDTLRAWERRYELPLPERTEGGHRLYSERDLKTVKWLLERQEEGMRIGQAAKLWKEITAAENDPFQEYPLGTDMLEAYQTGRVDRTSGSQEMYQLVREAWLEATLSFQEGKAQRILSEAFARYSLEDVWEEILVKGLAEIGDSWYQGEITVQQEHFATSLVIQRLHNLIDAAPPPIRKEVITVACPPGEYHTLSPLLITLFLRRRGYPVIYLGADVPLVDLDTSLETTGSRLVILTAQVLETAASLVRIAESLTQNGYLVGYGGRIFNLFPRMKERTPGFSLGERLTEAADRVEEILKTKLVEDLQAVRSKEEYSTLLEKFNNVELRLWDRLMGRSAEMEMTRDQMLVANNQLGKAIQASLYLNDLGYLQAELVWLKNLLGSRNVPEDQLQGYLQQVENTLSDLLGEEGAMLLEAIREARKHLEARKE